MFIVLEPSLILCDYKLIVFHQNLKTCPVHSFSIYHYTKLFFLPLSPGEDKLCKDKRLTVCIGKGDILLKLIAKSSQWIPVMLWDN